MQQQQKTQQEVAIEKMNLLDQVTEETQKRRATITEQTATVLGVAPSKVCSLLRNIWRTSKDQPDLTDNEMFQGMSLVARYGLDPITREIYVTKDKHGRLITIIGIDGWVKILNRTEGYDGFEQELEFNEKGQLEWAETRIYSKKHSKPTVYRAFWQEYAGISGFVAKSMPSHMLRLFSLRHAARLFTPIGGNVMTEEEANHMFVTEPADRTPPRSVQQFKEQFRKPESEVIDEEPVETVIVDEPEPSNRPCTCHDVMGKCVQAILLSNDPAEVKKLQTSTMGQIVSMKEPEDELERAITQLRDVAQNRLNELTKGNQ
jgi:hypothetical protein